MIGAILWGLAFGFWIGCDLMPWPNPEPLARLAFTFSAFVCLVETTSRLRRLIDRWFPRRTR